MKKKLDLPPPVVNLAAQQDGVVGFDQFCELGGPRAVLRRLVRDGIWVRVSCGIYATSPNPSWRGYAWAGVLIAGDGSVVGGRAAGHLHGFWEAPSSIDVWCGAKIARTDGPWRFRRGSRPGYGSPPRVGHATAALESASDEDGDEVMGALYGALNSGRTSVASLRAGLQAAGPLRHRKLIDQALTMASEGSESLLEERFIKLARSHGLPPLRQQASLLASTRCDVLFEAYGVVVELDGRLGHLGRGAFRDAERDNAHVLAGRTTLRFGWYDVVHRPCHVSSLVAEVLKARGWQGNVRRCRRCSR